MAVKSLASDQTIEWCTSIKSFFVRIFVVLSVFWLQMFFNLDSCLSEAQIFDDEKDVLDFVESALRSGGEVLVVNSVDVK